jgi:MSHA biogenesis protein MshJ
MKQAWQKFESKIDGFGLRERVMIFLMAVVVLIALINVIWLDPQFSKISELSQQIGQDQSQIAGLQAEIRATVANFSQNPDAAKLAELAQLQQKSTQMRATLLDMQKGVVSPDRMTALLEDILKQNGKLHLLSLRTLPASGLNDPVSVGKQIEANKGVNAEHLSADAKQKRDEASSGELVYKHGVEIVIEGNYLDMVDYMTALERLPWQLFWGEAKLTADESSKLSLTLTLYTLSLDEKWLNI